MTDKSLIRNFVAEVKQRRYLKDLFKMNTIDFDTYFKRSTEPIDHVDPTISIGEAIDNNVQLAFRKEIIKEKKIYTILNKEDSLIIDYFYRNPNKTLVTMAEDLKISKHKISKALNRNLDRSSW
jgi:hypothetical protein|tara:strand:+ start:3759 stop:4130 length:372 start_codon:yes stop_codon:yes gene_type:complete